VYNKVFEILYQMIANKIQKHLWDFKSGNFSITNLLVFLSHNTNCIFFLWFNGNPMSLIHFFEKNSHFLALFIIDIIIFLTIYSKIHGNFKFSQSDLKFFITYRRHIITSLKNKLK